MATVIRNAKFEEPVVKEVVRRGKSPIPDCVAKRLPPPLLATVFSGLEGGDCPEELRLRRNRPISLTVGGENRVLDAVTDGETLERILVSLCDGSLYAHRESLRQGYITLPGGVRVGIAGRAAVEDERVGGIYDVSALNFRFPCSPFACGEPVARLLRENRDSSGVLIYSPPGEGKTTLLRGLILRMAGGEHPLRVSVIDTREELMAGLEERRLLTDVFGGYPKHTGIEIATRCMRPQLLVCDEIGEQEAEAILGAQNAGVPLLATTHGQTVEGILSRPAMAKLHRAKVFFAYVGISRCPGARAFRYEITDWRQADEWIQHPGRTADDERRMDGRLVAQSTG